MLAVLARRLGQVLATVVLVSLLTFFLMRLLPGDAAQMLLGERGSDAGVARMRQQLGLDQSLAVQFWDFLTHMLTLRLGQSVSMRVPVAQLIAERLPITLMLTGLAATLAVLIAGPLAFVAALRPGSAVDVLVRMIAQLSLSMPVFYIGLVLLIVLGAGLHWFPVGGIGEGVLGTIHSLILPGLTLALSLSAVLLRNLRDQLIEVLQAEYVGFAVAKGLPRRLVLGRHVLRNAWISTITLLGLHIGSLVGGAVITETVFAIPGVGRLMIDSIFARDYAVVQGLTLVLAVLVSLVFVAVDTVQVWLDPRVAR
ncbi:MAG: ABC transporter permease [Acetobacteraceae bacterium]